MNGDQQLMSSRDWNGQLLELQDFGATVLSQCHRAHAGNCEPPAGVSNAIATSGSGLALAPREPAGDGARNRRDRLAPELLTKDTMTTRRMVVGWVLASGLSMVLACSSSQKPGVDRDGGGTGGAGGGGGGGRDGGGGGGGNEDARYPCGDASCSVGHDYCRDLASRGGASGTSGGDPNSQHALSCVPFGDCAARDCTCVPQNYLNFRCGCSQPDAGGTLAGCGQI